MNPLNSSLECGKSCKCNLHQKLQLFLFWPKIAIFSFFGQKLQFFPFLAKNINFFIFFWPKTATFSFFWPKIATFSFFGQKLQLFLLLPKRAIWFHKYSYIKCKTMNYAFKLKMSICTMLSIARSLQTKWAKFFIRKRLKWSKTEAKFYFFIL